MWSGQHWQLVSVTRVCVQGYADPSSASGDGGAAAAAAEPCGGGEAVTEGVIAEGLLLDKH